MGSDSLHAGELQEALRDCALLREIIVLEETTSTNDIAMKQGRAGAASGLVVFAERQTAGRGRHSRQWLSPSRQGLWFSLLLRPKIPRREWACVTTWAAVCIAEALDQFVSTPHMIKWPNDVFLEGRKIAGILAESDAEFVVLGIGVNVNQQQFPPDLREKATSLRLASGGHFDRQKIASSILRRLDERSAQLDENFPQIVQAATSRSMILGRSVEVSAGSSVLRGTAESLDAEGALQIRTDDGTLISVSSGEVTRFHFS